ncbi:hypothetical protein GCM10023405_18010 [Streptomonospora salina]
MRRVDEEFQPWPTAPQGLVRLPLELQLKYFPLLRELDYPTLAAGDVVPRFEEDLEDWRRGPRAAE